MNQKIELMNATEFLISKGFKWLESNSNFPELMEEYANLHIADDSKIGLDREMASVLNKYSQENASDTPDFILADYLLQCLAAYNKATQQRTQWYSHEPENLFK